MTDRDLERDDVAKLEALECEAASYKQAKLRQLSLWSSSPVPYPDLSMARSWLTSRHLY